MRDINLHIIHCSYSMHGDAKEIDRWHKERGWDGIGYHYVILRDGSLQVGRSMAKIGAHCKGYNRNSIGTCLIGKDGNFTYEQFKTLHSLHYYTFKKLFGNIPIKGHNEFSSTKTCPTFNVKEIMKCLNQSTT